METKMMMIHVFYMAQVLIKSKKSKKKNMSTDTDAVITVSLSDHVFVKASREFWCGFSTLMHNMLEYDNNNNNQVIFLKQFKHAEKLAFFLEYFISCGVEKKEAICKPKPKPTRKTKRSRNKNIKKATDSEKTVNTASCSTTAAVAATSSSSSSSSSSRTMMERLIDHINTYQCDVNTLFAEYATFGDFCALIDLLEYLDVDKSFTLVMRFQIEKYASTIHLQTNKTEVENAYLTFGNAIVERTVDYTFNLFERSSRCSFLRDLVDIHSQTQFVHEVDMMDDWHWNGEDSQFVSGMPHLLAMTNQCSRVVYLHSIHEEEKIDWDRLESILILNPNVVELSVVLLASSDNRYEILPLSVIQNIQSSKEEENDASPPKKKSRVQVQLEQEKQNKTKLGLFDDVGRLKIVQTSMFSVNVYVDRETFAKEIFIIRLVDTLFGLEYSYFGGCRRSGRDSCGSCWIDFDRDRSYDIVVFARAGKTRRMAKPNRFYNTRCDYYKLYAFLYHILKSKGTSYFGTVPFDVTFWPSEQIHNNEVETILRQMPVLVLGSMTMYFEPYPFVRQYVLRDEDQHHTLMEKFLSLRSEHPEAPDGFLDTDDEHDDDTKEEEEEHEGEKEAVYLGTDL